MPIIEHVMQALAQGRDLRDRKVCSEISDQVLPLIQDLPRPEEREFYTQKLARFLRIDAARLHWRAKRRQNTCKAIVQQRRRKDLGTRRSWTNCQRRPSQD